MTEGAEPELLLFSRKWNRWCLSGLVRSEPPRWRRRRRRRRLQMQLPSDFSVLLLQVLRSIFTAAGSRQLKVAVVYVGFGGKSV